MRKFISVVCMFLAFVSFFVGMHNVDLAWNIDKNADCMDYNSFLLQSQKEMYINGMNIMRASVIFFFMAIAIFFLPSIQASKNIYLSSTNN